MRQSERRVKQQLGNVEQRVRILVRNQKQRSGGTGWRTATLLPFLKGAHRNAE
jgi:hypothetical protein